MAVFEPLATFVDEAAAVVWPLSEESMLEVVNVDPLLEECKLAYG